MKKKIFTLLTLLLAVCSGAWAQTASDSYLDIEQYATMDDAGWSKTADKNYSWDATNHILVVNAYQMYQSRSKQKWISADNNGSTNSSTWVATDVFKGGDYYNCDDKKCATATDVRVYTFSVTNITEARALVNPASTGRVVSLTVKIKNGNGAQVGQDLSPKSKNSEVLIVDGLDASKIYEVSVAGNAEGTTSSGNSQFYEIAFIGQAATETFTVTFDAGTNGTCATSSLTEESPGAGVTLPSVTANSGFAFTGWFTAATDGTKVGDAGATYKPTANVTVYAQYSEISAPTISVDASATTVAKNEAVTLTATVSGSPAPTIQWYSNTTESNTGGTAIDGATNTTYSPSTSTPGTYHFYAVATNSQGSVASNVLTITVNASNVCKLLQVVYSNTFDAFINEPTAESGTPGEEDYVAASNGTVVAYYMEGTAVPTITSITVSDDATYDVTGNTLTVTAEDGTTSAIYDITVESVSPFKTIDEATFDGNETWIKGGPGFDSVKGWVFRKNANDGRISQGLTRLYFFVGKAGKVTLTNGGVSSERNIKVYVNGVENTEITKVPKNNNNPNSITIPCNADAYNMIAIVSNQTNGDGGFTKISLEAPASVPISTKEGRNYATCVPNFDLDFSATDEITAYIATGLNSAGDAVVITPVDVVPAGTPILVKTATQGATVDVPVTSLEPDNVAGNKFVAGDGTTDVTTVTDYTYYYLASDEFHEAIEGTLQAGKAYLAVPKSSAGAHTLNISFDNSETTGIETIDNGQLTMDNVYNLAGQRVAQPTKGLYIVNGKKVIIK